MNHVYALRMKDCINHGGITILFFMPSSQRNRPFAVYILLDVSSLVIYHEIILNIFPAVDTTKASSKRKPVWLLHSVCEISFVHVACLTGWFAPYWNSVGHLYTKEAKRQR